MAEPPTYEPAPKRSWQVLIIVAVFLFGIVAAGVTYVRGTRSVPPPAAGETGAAIATPATPAPNSLPMQGVQTNPALPPPPVSRAPTVGRLGIDTATCPSFAEIAARFWDLKSGGTSIASAYAAIEQGSAGDEKKIKLLKSLAQVVYANATPSRELAYRNALEACLRN